MSKRIAFCADGTWDGSGNNTNVYRIFKAMKISADQMPFYDDGVGTDGHPLERLAGGAMGLGLFQKIKDGYTKIAQVYEQGDDLFLFGFSRGAYTARALGGMILACGLPTHSFNDATVESAFNAYRNRDQRDAILAQINTQCSLFKPRLQMVGVWDTVGALGIPAIAGGIDQTQFGFLDTSLNPGILHAYHALSIDERRREFPATLWSTQPADGQILEQVWFTGVHCDVGGSYPGDPDGTALSDITLGWMMSKAAALGIEFDADVFKKYTLPLDAKCSLDAKHESWTALWGFPSHRSIPDDATLANSVVLRLQHDVSYRPQNLTVQNGAPAATYKVAGVV
jgi:uncharacterized protein (DUF2235 family)